MLLEQTRVQSIVRMALPLLAIMVGFAWGSAPLIDTVSPLYHAHVIGRLALVEGLDHSPSGAVVGQQQALQKTVSMALPGLVSQRFEGEIERRIKSLESSLEEAIGLDLFSRPYTLPVTGNEVETSTYDGSYEVALLQRASAPLEDGINAPDGQSELGIGGAELECADDECDQDEASQKVQLPAPTLVREQDIRTSLQLNERFDRVFSLLKFLPIGAPAAGHISSGFGGRRSPFSRHRSFHYGIDLSMGRGGRVVTTGAGTVVRVGYHRTYGTVVDIEHLEGLVTRYAHLARAMVKLGQPVIRGQLIALSGSTGRSTGPHLHYEVIHDGKARDPEPFIQLADRLVGVSSLIAGQS